MKKCLLWMLAAILLCGTTATLTSCNEETKILDLNGNSVEYGKKLSVSSSELLGWKVLLKSNADNNSGTFFIFRQGDCGQLTFTGQPSDPHIKDSGLYAKWEVKNGQLVVTDPTTNKSASYELKKEYIKMDGQVVNGQKIDKGYYCKVYVGTEEWVAPGQDFDRQGMAEYLWKVMDEALKSE
ncbi:MAG: hypothetical protein IJK51_01805 [Bacteroidaceae bacterium]|nr:hypothetical protein [Bacteroidaceae bacterium]